MKVIKNAMLPSGLRRDIVINDGVIEDIVKDYDGHGDVIYVEEGTYVSPGWIDMHTHTFPKFPPYCAHPDEIGYMHGVTTVVDAGSSGADDIDEFYTLAKQCKTNVLAFLNISRIGLKRMDELSRIDDISIDEARKAIDRYEHFIVGLKARMSQSVIGESGIAPLKLGKELSEKTSLPLMVHIGNAPPTLDEMLPYLKKGDIITHCFHAKHQNNIFHEQILDAMLVAIKKGVYLDVGHGTASFSFQIAKVAKRKNLPFHSISTDIYEKNKEEGPVYNMATTLTKFLALGYSLEEVIRAVTEVPAEILKLHRRGRCSPGAIADFTFFSIDDEEIALKDSEGYIQHHREQIKVNAVMLGGEYIEL
ncbi:amidohydrolase/deacetylase family metallohydrolase [Evansella cellulosilytica]|uniref:Amidohydrolase n=1 Tax=Evansella cellulosilytica (strain ATCC 21833 / DSM 2522 / FERM P-1141 / JCM 9156 / N-4) TaxID=649639 RepID=E6TT33_EVAC2|nr:amidohydrolase/deacetylase family metallohydrolase [Evansella cellulosilytica]ADU31941.1 amidohydrolase [Evansella cellulosilytica DSM 2522]